MIWLKQGSVSFIHRNVVKVYFSYKLDTWSRVLSTVFTLSICLFGAMKLTKYADPDKFGYSSYGIGFDGRLQFLLLGGSLGKVVVVFGADMSSSVHVDNEKIIS